MVRRLVAEHGLDDPQERLQDQQAHPLDTHPPLKQRLDALGVAITPELPARAIRATPRCWSSWGWNPPYRLERRQPASRRFRIAYPFWRRHE